MRRRDFLLLSTAAALWPGGSAAAAEASTSKRLVVILLRGAVDGLSVVVPYAEPAYYQARDRIAIARPGTPDGALGLDGQFGLHPALGALMPLWREKQLAFVHAAGSPDPTRSHFEAQLYLESGTPGHDGTPDGWLNRALGALPGRHGPTAAFAAGPILPRLLHGQMPVANLPLGAAATQPLPLDRPEIGAAFDRLYAGDNALGRTYREGRAARAELVAALAAEDKTTDGGSPPPNGFPAQAQRLAGLMARDPRIRLAYVGLGGWDTHVSQGSHAGRLADRLRPLGDGLAAFARGLGAAWADTVVVVLSEFGRTLHENEDGGTDHGHGNAIWVLGGPVVGGHVYGDWPGLDPAALYQRRDLAVTTDYRAALAVVLERHLRLPDVQLDTVFPGLPPARPELAKMIAA